MIAQQKCSLRILITAGPTQEPIDKVRFISNPSTGKMGYELARAALRRGHRVTLISGPTNIIPPKGLKFVSTRRALQMYTEVRRHFKQCDCLIMAAAVSDFRPKRAEGKKIKKANLGSSFVLELVKNPDILLEAGERKGKKILVGFALETENLIKNAHIKLKEKNLDLIVASQLTPSNSLFGDKRINAVMLNAEGVVDKFSFLTKRQIANIVLRRVEKISNKRLNATKIFNF